MKFDPSHNSALINYYYTNYSTCPVDTSYFASWQFLSGFLHTVLIFQSPLVVFTGYCIIKKTPQAMGSLKWAMLNLLFWSTYMDIVLCSLVTPYLMFPAIGGFTVGVLRWLGVPITFQAYLGIASLGFMLNSISALFENRSSSFEINRFRFTRTSSRFTFFVLNGLVTAVCLLPIFLYIPDQDSAKMKQLEVSLLFKTGSFSYFQTLPCPHPEYFSSPVFIFINDGYWAWYLTVILSIQAAWIFFSMLFFITCITYHIFYSTSASYSYQTKRLQKVFFIGNLIQVAIPTVFWAVPAYSLMFSVVATYYNQSLNNICVAFVSLHGFASMITTLAIHRPYRSYLISFFKTKNKTLVGPTPPFSTDN